MEKQIIEEPLNLFAIVISFRINIENNIQKIYTSFSIITPLKPNFV